MHAAIGQPFGLVKGRSSFDNQIHLLGANWATLAVYFEKLASFWAVGFDRECVFISVCLYTHHRYANRAKDSEMCRDEPSKGELRTLKSQLLNISCHDPLAASDANSSKTRTVSLGMWF